jgi:hypothetical protein
VGSQVPPYHHYALIVVLYRQILPNTLHCVHLLLSHDALTSHAASWIHPTLPSKRRSSSIVPMFNWVWKFLPWWKMSSLTLGHEKVLFHPEHLIKLMYQEDRVMKRNTSRIMKRHSILQGETSTTHWRKSYMSNWEVLLFSIVLISSVQYILHRFLCSSSLHKSCDVISFTEGGL